MFIIRHVLNIWFYVAYHVTVTLTNRTQSQWWEFKNINIYNILFNITDICKKNFCCSKKKKRVNGNILKIYYTIYIWYANISQSYLFLSCCCIKFPLNCIFLTVLIFLLIISVATNARWDLLQYCWRYYLQIKYCSLNDER